MNNITKKKKNCTNYSERQCDKLKKINISTNI